MSNPKFKRGDVVGLIKPNLDVIDEDYFTVMHSTSTFKYSTTNRYLIEGNKTKDTYDYKESSLYLFTPENRTRILLGLDPE